MRVRTNLAALAAAVALCVSASAARGEELGLEAYRGEWRYADGARGRQEIERAIERAVADLPFFMRPFASDRVREIAIPFERVTFYVRGDRLAFRADGWGPVGSRVGGPFEQIRDPYGTPLELQQSIRNGRLVQVFRGGDGERENVFALSGDGQWLWMSVRISSPRLPADARYRLRYRRVSAPTVQHSAR